MKPSKNATRITLLLLVAATIGFALLNTNTDTASWQMSSINSDGTIQTPSGGYRFSLVDEYAYRSTQTDNDPNLDARATVRITRYYDEEQTGFPYEEALYQTALCEYEGSTGALYIYRDLVEKDSDWPYFWRVANCNDQGCTSYDQIKSARTPQEYALATQPTESPESVTYVCWTRRDGPDDSWVWVATAYSFWDLPRVIEKLEEPVFEEPPIEEPPVEEPPVEQPPTEEPPTEEQPVPEQNWLARFWNSIVSFFRGVFTL